MIYKAKSSRRRRTPPIDDYYDYVGMNFVDCATTELNKPNRDCFDLMVFFGKIYCFLFLCLSIHIMLGWVLISFLILSSMTLFSNGTWKGVSIVCGHFWALPLLLPLLVSKRE